MSCGCENRRLGSEIERIRRLAKAFAKMEETTVMLIGNDDGTYGFLPINKETDKTIIEFITPY